MDTRRRERVLLWSSIAVCFLLAELFLRLFHPQKTETQLLRDNPAMYSESTWVNYALTPGFVGRHRASEFDTEIRLNSLGQRQREIDIDEGRPAAGARDRGFVQLRLTLVRDPGLQRHRNVLDLKFKKDWALPDSVWVRWVPDHAM